MKKIIILGVIVLFIGVGFQPAFAVESKSYIDTLEKVEDCDCQELDSLNLIRAKLLLNKLKVFIKVILSRFRHIPEVEEKSQEILDVINSFNLVSGPPIICAMLEALILCFWDLSDYFWEKYLDAISEVMRIIYSVLTDVFFFIGLPFFYIGEDLDCWTPDDPPITPYEIEQIVSN